jgi:hypothetical protein
MKAFTLHDGEDDQKTEALHAFLDPLTSQDQNDWDSGNHGITLLINVNMGDTIVLRDDGSVRVIPKTTEKVLITPHTFFQLHAAMLSVELDNGAHHVNRIAGETVVDLDVFSAPYSRVLDVVNADAALDRLADLDEDMDWDTLVTGEQSEQEAVLLKYGLRIPGLQAAHELINDWFNGWES